MCARAIVWYNATFILRLCIRAILRIKKEILLQSEGNLLHRKMIVFYCKNAPYS